MNFTFKIEHWDSDETDIIRLEEFFHGKRTAFQREYTLYAANNIYLDQNE